MWTVNRSAGSASRGQTMVESSIMPASEIKYIGDNARESRNILAYKFQDTVRYQYNICKMKIQAN